MTSVSLRLIFRCLLPPVFTCWKINAVRQISLGIQPGSGHVTAPNIYQTATMSTGTACCSVMQYVVCNLEFSLYCDALLPGRTLSVYFRFILACAYACMRSEPRSCASSPQAHSAWVGDWSNRQIDEQIVGAQLSVDKWGSRLLCADTGALNSYVQWPFHLP